MTMSLNKVILILVIVSHAGFCDRVKDRIYYDVHGIVQCYRRLNGTHQIGCSSKQSGNVGILHYISGDEELNWLLKEGPHQPYIVLLTQETFNIEVINQLSESGKVDGVIVSSTDAEINQRAQFSPDSDCPNSNYELYKDSSTYGHCKKTKWNPKGNNLLMTDIKFPIINAANKTEIDFLISECYEKFNKPNGGLAREYPLCGAQIKAAMDAVKDTPTCINRGKTRNMNPQRYCDPLGDRNVYSFLHHIPIKTEGEFEATLENRSVIVASAKLDATGLFQYIIPGAHTTVVGFISLLAAAEALGRVKHEMEDSKPIMFAFFQGESFDYMGSIRMLYDMERGQFPCKPHANSEGIHPIYPHHIGNYLEVNQVAEKSLYMHSDPISKEDEKFKDGVATVEQLLVKFGEQVGLNLQSTEDDLPLPPASVQTFLKKSNFSGVVLTDFEKEFQNKFYNGYGDIPSHLNYTRKTNESQTDKTELSEHLTKVGTIVARTLYNMSTGNEPSENLIANGSLVAEMIYCFFLTPQCDLFNMTVDDEETAAKLPYYPYSFYVGIRNLRNPVTKHVNNLLAYFTGDTVNLTKSECQNYDDEDDDKINPRSPFYNYLWIHGSVNESSPDRQRVGICLQTTANLSSGVSPAFLDGHDLSNTEYPAWSESIWATETPSVRVFLIPDKNYEIAGLVGGLMMFLLSFIAVYFCHSRSALIFGPNDRFLLSTSVDS